MGTPGLTNCDPDRQPLLLGHRELWERFSAASRHGPRFEDGLSEGSVACQGMFPVSSLGPPAHPAGLRLGKLEGLQEKA